MAPLMNARQRNWNALNCFETFPGVKKWCLWWLWKGELEKVCRSTEVSVWVQRREALTQWFCWGWGTFTLPRAFGNVWRHFWLSKLASGSYWHLMDRDQRCSLTSYNAQDTPAQERVIQPPTAQISAVLRLINWTLIHPRESAGWGRGKAGNVLIACLRRWYSSQISKDKHVSQRRRKGTIL